MKNLKVETFLGLLTLALIVGFLICRIFSPRIETYVQYKPIVMTNVVIMRHYNPAVIRHYKEQNEKARIKLLLFRSLNGEDISKETGGDDKWKEYSL